MADEAANGNDNANDSGDASSDGSPVKQEQKSSAAKKDPNRVKRKKARRACAACQRAHLTCGDERPCERCIKRGLEADCKDGARKKAKYLRDAPDEALAPGAGQHYYNQNNGGAGSPQDAEIPQASDSGFMDNSQPNRPSFGQQEAIQLNPFAAQPVAMQPQTMNGQQRSSMQNLQPSFQSTVDQPFLGSFNDPNFDPALGFGMNEVEALKRMSSNYAPNYRHGSAADWRSHARTSSWPSQAHSESLSDASNTYAIGNGMGSYAGISPPDFAMPYEGTPPNNTLRRQKSYQQSSEPSIKQEREHRPSKDISKKLEQLPPGKVNNYRRMNAKRVHEQMITTGYPYTARFHSLIALIKRYPSKERIRIAKALGSIRPSFIACTRTLIQEDLILMERCLQRSLLEYQDHIASSGTPSLCLRRTMEVAYSGESFSYLSQWPSAVLLGKTPNLNVNRAGDSGTPSGPGTGVNTPYGQTSGPDLDGSVPYPVSLVQLIDSDSAVAFFEAYASVAFADSKGSGRLRCRVLKYKTQSKGDALNNPNRFDDSGNISRLGEADGSVDCMVRKHTAHANDLPKTPANARF